MSESTAQKDPKSGQGLKWALGAGIALIAIGLAVLLLIISAVMSVVSTNEQQSADRGCVAAGSTSDSDGVTNGAPDAPGDVKEDQIKNAKAIDQVVADLGLPGKASKIAIIAAMGESTLINVDYGDQRNGVTNPDGSAATSYGLFQQQTSMGWGSKDEVMDPEHATKSFLMGPDHNGSSGLVTISGWQDREITQVIHDVQGNADASHYARSYDSARAIIDEAGIDLERGADESKMKAAGVGEAKEDSGGGDTGSPDGSSGTASGCAEKGGGGSWDGDLGPGEWTNPLPGGQFTSGYGQRDISGVPEWAKNHVGVDIATPGAGNSPGGQVIAPTDLRITGFMTEQSEECVMAKQEGEPGFGFAFCHLDSNTVEKADKLKKGEIIGVEGNRGQIQGMATHLHVEMYKPGSPEMNYPYEGFNIDPEPIMKEKGAWPE